MKCLQFQLQSFRHELNYPSLIHGRLFLKILSFPKFPTVGGVLSFSFEASACLLNYLSLSHEFTISWRRARREEGWMMFMTTIKV